MTDWYLLLTPLLMFGVVALVGFVGCDQVLGLNRVDDPAVAPTNLQGMGGDHRVDLFWDPYDEENGVPTQFNIKRGVISGTYPDIRVEMENVSAYTDPNVLNGTTYYYVVSAHVEG